MSNDTVSIEEQLLQPNPFEPMLEPFMSPMAMSYFALIVVLLILKNIQPRNSVLGKARLATPAEVRKATQKGRRQIAEAKLTRSALELHPNLVLANVQPAMALVGQSGSGKTESVMNPALHSAIDQDWTIFCFDVKGEFLRTHGAYALAKGYDLYHYYPGHKCDGLNFLKFMNGKYDAKTAEEIAKIMEMNFGEPGERKDGFFSPQGVAALRLAFMMAKATCYPDLVTAWKFLSLPNFAKRMAKAKELNLLGEELDFGTWISEASTPLRTMSESGRTIDGILGTSMTNFLRMVDSSIIPCLTNHTIPLDMRGKQIVFFQLDETAQSATAPLVAAAIHMLITRNLRAGVNRTNPLGLFLDEFDSIYLPNIQDYINKMRSYGLVTLLSYQSNAQLYRRYSKNSAISILSSCKTKIYFNTGHHQTAQELSTDIGKTEVKYKTESKTFGKNPSRNQSEHIQLTDLVTANEVNEQKEGEAYIKSPGWGHRAYKHQFPEHHPHKKLWKETCPQIWDEKIVPYRTAEIEKMQGDNEVALINREVIAEANLPSEKELEMLSKLLVAA